MRFDALSTEAHALATEIFGHDVVAGKKVNFPAPGLPWWATSFPPGAAGESLFVDGIAREMIVAPFGQTSARVWLCLSRI